MGVGRLAVWFFAALAPLRGRSQMDSPKNPCLHNNGGCEVHLTCMWEEGKNEYLCVYSHDCGVLPVPGNGRVVCSTEHTHEFALYLVNASMTNNDEEASKCSLICNHGYSMTTGKMTTRNCGPKGWDDDSPITCTLDNNCHLPGGGSTCGTHGICTNGVGSFNCVCVAGFFGDRCEHADPCASSPCPARELCHHKAGTSAAASYECVIAGAVHVSTQCTATKCQHGGKCHDGGTSFHCDCAAGYGGPTCHQGPPAVAGVTGGPHVLTPLPEVLVSPPVTDLHPVSTAIPAAVKKPAASRRSWHYAAVGVPAAAGVLSGLILGGLKLHSGRKRRRRASIEAVLYGANNTPPGGGGGGGQQVEMDVLRDANPAVGGGATIYDMA